MVHILIAGAGIGGLTTAIALSRAGATVTILERSSALSEIGAGLQLSPNATRVLDRLGLLAAVAHRASRPDAIRVKAAGNGRTLAILPLQHAEQRWGAPYLVIHRADLQEVLTAAVAADSAIDLQLGTTVAGLGTTARGVVVAAKQDLLARSFEGDGLIGADGIRSTVRARLVADAADAPIETGWLAWRGSVECSGADGGRCASETGLWLGPNAHLVHYPLRAGTLLNIVAITRDPGARWTDGWGEPGDPAVLGARFARWHASAKQLLAAVPNWTTWPLLDRAPLAAWNAGAVALLGDAAHPILPFFAQGAAQAIEDAEALATAVSAHRSLPDAFAAFSRRRSSRVAMVQDASRRLGRIYHLSGPSAFARNVGMQLIGSQRLLSRYDWLYGAGRASA